jgi:isopentenyl phosphate kinase
MTILARTLRPSKVIFATNVDGIYRNTQSKKLISEIGVSGKKLIDFSKVSGADVTGGMQRKVTEAFKIASYGMDVLIVNGLVPDRIVDATRGTLKVGTVVRGIRR